ncbi:MAG: RnfABCDGE type electron transport complex subunit D [Treponema sp.]|nr:RnfABCDGE type electron transport complex subunit D [Treponema sp.]
MSSNNLTVSYAPHIRDRMTTSRIMLDVIIALIPSFIVAVVVFGPRSVLVTGVCAAACVACEWAYEKILNRKNTVKDMSAVLTGILLAFNLPVTIPLWQAVFGCFVAIILVKQIFGGLGKNFANPAITARIVMFLAFPITMSTWVVPFDAITGPTPLAYLLKGEIDAMPGTMDLFLGVHGGCLGETSDLALLIGGVYLLARRVITWHAPVTFIATVLALSAVTGTYPVYQIFSGGLFLGAIFMATDYVTTPLTRSGRAIFGIGAGLITVLIRLYGSYPEGVSFGILIMNMIVPYINKITMSKPLGGIKP